MTKRILIVDETGECEIGGVEYVLVKKDAITWLNGEGSFECPPERYFRGEPPRYWWRSVFRDKAALSAAALDLSGLPGVPESRTQTEDERYHPDAHYECGLTDGWNEALDAIGVKNGN